VIALTIGEPAGIGPDIILQLWQQQPDLLSAEKITLIGNQSLLQKRAEKLGLKAHIDSLSIIDIPLPAECIPGKLDARNAPFVIDMLTFAAEKTLQKKFSAIVTAPIHKGIINDAGFSFAGHTDFFSKFTQCETVMMLMTSILKVALLTDHIPLSRVPQCVTEENISRCLDIIIRDFKRHLRITDPTILICGLNPHAGEQGYLGKEEQDVMIPAIKKYNNAGHHIIGPIGADVAFTKPYRDKADVILTMYHDQGLPVIKYSGFHHAINVTLGLPFLRTSVDHGTALDIAGTGHADVTSLANAIEFAKTAQGC
jgi:4-hydroxythreonine-4-phosphate dehydrogenase